MNACCSLQAQALCQFTTLPDHWLFHPQCLVGLFLYLWGMSINLQSDAILRKLRRQSSAYQIPRGGMFDLVSAPHYFGELVQWAGFSLANRLSLASVAFSLYTAANLIPRGVAHHAWYRRVFTDDYPKDRRAVIPFVW
jgi:steroid 5-alpha reductase family enzyme